MSDNTLLQGFSKSQQDYIIANLFPLIKKTLIHFVYEARDYINTAAAEEANQPTSIEILGVGKFVRKEQSTESSKNATAKLY